MAEPRNRRKPPGWIDLMQFAGRYGGYLPNRPTNPTHARTLRFLRSLGQKGLT